MRKPTCIWSAILACPALLTSQSSQIVVYECISLSEKNTQSGMYACVYGLCVLDWSCAPLYTCQYCACV